MKFQVMPDLSADEFAALKADIAERGVLVPVEYDEDGNVLDGHHRIRACEELGVSDWPKFVRKGLSDEEKLQHARQLNLARRHLSREQREPLWADMRAGGMSYRQIAEVDGTASHQTIMRSIGPDGPVEQPEAVIGKDGKKRKPIRKLALRDARADYLLYCFAQDGHRDLLCHLIDFQKLKSWFWPLEPTFTEFQMKTQNRTFGRQVPIARVKAEVGVVEFTLSEPVSA